MLTLDRQNAWREHYRRINPTWQPATEVYAQLVRDHLHPTSRILDLGCGRGGLVEQLGHPLEQIVGIDPDFASLREHRLGLQGVQGLGQLPFADRSFDLIFASWVLEHWADPVRELAEIGRILTPTGNFIFITPNRRHPLLWLNRALGGLQKSLVKTMYGRDEDDTFPIFYRANTPQMIATASQLHLTTLYTISDPSYLAFNRSLFRAMCLVEQAMPIGRRLHLVGVLSKSHSA